MSLPLPTEHLIREQEAVSRIQPSAESARANFVTPAYKYCLLHHFHLCNYCFQLLVTTISAQTPCCPLCSSTLRNGSFYAPLPWISLLQEHRYLPALATILLPIPGGGSYLLQNQPHADPKCAFTLYFPGKEICSKPSWTIFNPHLSVVALTPAPPSSTTTMSRLTSHALHQRLV